MEMKKVISIIFLLLGSFLFVWSDEPIIIGREEGDGMLIYPRQIEEGPDGNIYVYDMADAYIKVYSPEGNIFISGRWDDEEQGINYWLLDENGKTLAKISSDVFGLRISQHLIFYSTRDEEENILIHCLKRKGTEKEDLLRISKK